MKKLSLMLMLSTALMTFLGSCSKDEQVVIRPKNHQEPNPHVTPETQKDTITNFFVYFSNPADESTQVGAYEDPDGPGPKEACIGAVVLKANTQYLVTFMIEDGSNSKKRINIDSKIRSNGKDYKICISNPLGTSFTAIDSDGSLPIGLENQMFTTSSTGSSSFNFSIKYQKGVKNGDCFPGTVYYNCSIPVSIY